MVFKYIITPEGAVIFPKEVSFIKVALGFNIFSAGYCKMVYDGEVRIVEVFNSDRVNKDNLPHTRIHKEPDLKALNWLFQEINPNLTNVVTIADLYKDAIKADNEIDMHAAIAKKLGNT